MQRFSKTYSMISGPTPLFADVTAPYPPARYLQVPAGATVTAKSRDFKGVTSTITLAPLSDQTYPGHWVSLDSTSGTAVVVVIWEVES